MRHPFNRLILAILFFSTLPVICFSQELTTTQWQEDLQFLRNLVINERPNLFHTITREEWEQQANELQKQLPKMSRHEAIVGFARLVAAFRIGHTRLLVDPWEGNAHSITGFGRIPVLPYVYSDGVFIRSISEKYRDVVGSRIIKIEKMPIREAMEAVRPVIPWENEQFFIEAVPYYLSCPEILHAQGVISDPRQVTITVEKQGRQQEIVFPAEPAARLPRDFGLVKSGSGWVDARQFSDNPIPLYLQNLDRNFYYTYLPENKVVYVRHSQVRNEPDETIEQFFSGVMVFVENNDVEKFVLDLRLNGGGNNYLNKPVIVGLIGSHKINQPGRLFTIIGRRTFSAAQNLVNEIEKYTETIFIGEPTAENVNFWGDNRQYELPNSKLPLRLSWLWWQNLDPRDNRPWTAPQIAVDLTFEDYRNNHDPVMEEILNFQPQAAFIESLQALVRSGEYENARKAARNYANDPRHRYHNFEDEINRAGYELLGQANLDEAVAMFRLNTELYPNSANTFDSFAEGLWKQGKLEAAIENYQIALRMDPDGVGVNSARMLQQVREQLQQEQNVGAQ